ncbi:hypothetical protein [Schnuerera sp.]|uniref:hypothetical protein n=1 Tax=Schnuerera sp. TaxID=2794844 RepID=UPI002C6DA4FF|nr:hypothetical protein [Schnuerera sp.]HSH36293.1 hypothetical protein [Schnuerera sp.]
MYTLIDELEKRITTIENHNFRKDLDLLKEKVADIENFLNNRTRGFYGRYKSR